jgi:hypothetical protein
MIILLLIRSGRELWVLDCMHAWKSEGFCRVDFGKFFWGRVHD